jgi:hypothetical protein
MDSVDFGGRTNRAGLCRIWPRIIYNAMMDLKFHTLRKPYHSRLKFLLDLSLIRDAVRAGPELNSNVWHRASGTRVIKLITIFANRIAAESASVHGATLADIVISGSGALIPVQRKTVISI